MTPPKPAAERPATFGNVFAEKEYRALFAASATSWFGDNLARAAATALVFTVTDSVVLSAMSFAISYLPGITCGPLLAALAERYPHRAVMITCDVTRAVLISLVAIPALPVPAILLLLFATALLNPAFDASRSALLPRILDGDRYIVGVSVQTTTTNVAMVCGYLAGGALAPFHPHLAMLLDGATFATSGAILAVAIRPRPVIAKVTQRRRLITETVAGFRLVFGGAVLRSIAAIVFFGAMFVVVPEGIAAAWAAELSHHGSDRGFDQALIMAASPVGAVTGAMVIGRLLTPVTRGRILRPLAVLVPLVLVPAFLVQSAVLIGVLTAVSAFAVTGLSTTANGLFVQALPAEFRARAFGVMQFGLALFQAAGLLIAGVIAGYVSVSVAVTIFSAVGVGIMTSICVTWPSADRLRETIASVKEHNAETLAAAEAVAAANSRTSRSRASATAGAGGNIAPDSGAADTGAPAAMSGARTGDARRIPAPSSASDETVAAGADGARPTHEANDRRATDHMAVDDVPTDRVATDRLVTDRVATASGAQVQPGRPVHGYGGKLHPTTGPAESPSS